MITDFRDIDLAAETSDICIVGGGAAGLTLAVALGERGLRVLVLEGGGFKPTKAGADRYAGEVEDPKVHALPHHYRVRALGGASRIWGGRCLPYDPIDFETRPWIAGKGWPIPSDEVAAYYPKAQHAAEAGPFDFTPRREMVPGLDGDAIATTVERFSRPSDFGRRWREAVDRAPNIRLVLNADVTAVKLAGLGDRVDHLEVAGPDGGRIAVRSGDYVLALGGLETVRLMLASDDVTPGGVGASGGWLGRGYMCHVAATIGEVRLTGDPAEIAYDYERDAEGVYLRHRLWVTPKAQRDGKLLNLAFRLHLPDPADPAHGDSILSAMFLAKNLVQYEYSRKFREAPVTWRTYAGHLANIVKHPFRLLAFARKWIVGRHMMDRKIPSVVLFSKSNAYSVEFHAEQETNRDSRLTLTDERDAAGMRRLKVDWRVTPLDIESVRRSYRLLASELKRTGAGALTFDEATLERKIMEAGAYGGHHVGAARMSADPQDGVVDTDCRVHGVANLYLASAAVMPTSSQANPTLTVLALTYRLADRLAARFKATPAAATDREPVAAG